MKLSFVVRAFLSVSDRLTSRQVRVWPHLATPVAMVPAEAALRSLPERRSPRRTSRFTEWNAILAFVGILVLLASRIALSPSDFVPKHPSVLKSERLQDKKQCVEDDGLDWAAPAQLLQPILPAATAQCSETSAAPVPRLQRKGFHYNRPPPLG